MIVKNSLYIFNLSLESKSDSADNVNILDSNDNTPVTTSAGNSGRLCSHGTLGTPPSKLKNTKLGNNLYLISSSGQLERSASEVSNIIINLGNLGSSKISIV